MKRTATLASLVVLLSVASGAMAQTSPSRTPASASPAAPSAPPAFGMPINGDQAQQALTAAEAEARRNRWALTFAVVDTYGNLIMFKMMPGTGPITSQMAMRKAKTAAMLRMPSKNLQEMAARGSTLTQAIPELVAVEGGVPIILDGKIIGAIGASGAQSSQDAQAAIAGAAAVR